MNFFKNLKNQIQEKNKFFQSFFVLIGFLLLLYVSWFYLSQSSIDGEEERVHSFLQNEFQILVSDFVSKKHPEVKEITFHKVWTKKTPDSNKIKIFFSYSLLLEGEAGGGFLAEGEALLERPKERDSWLIKEFQITDSLLEFSEPLLIKADSSTEVQ